MTTASPHPEVVPQPHHREGGGSTSTTRWQKAVGVTGLVVVFWVGDRLYDVIDSGGSGPGGDHAPAGGTPSTLPTDRDSPTPGGDDDGHDPSQFDR